jgi:hypothetical protein
MKDLTQEQIEKNVSAAFDSVALIDTLQAKEVLTDEDNSTISRNVEHLKIMMGKDWFVKALSAAQKTKINSIIK